ncbi:ectoine utilization protein EutC [Pelagibacterium xiamenense]|uniref:ectoine utilization protein EutC n=1 Tax=Pelagibacterium xiamenense TaxID=2901140 RepID=UPI001E50EDAE|nr:ectoine utilization protein EutC [Pelagibacterium xiamenense]MCD7059377.1 ectoine utilization protein EutC [Pelagibacterium xiamenense]
MPDVSILTEAQLRDLVPLDADAVACVEDAFATLAAGKVAMPDILRLDILEANGEVDVKTAYVPGLDSFAIKVSPGFFDNPKIGLPSVNGLMVVLSARTGLLEALLLDNGYLTDVRTAAAGAVAAKHLSRPEAARAAIIGAGVQARLQLKALTLVRPIREAVIWARDAGKAEALAREASQELGIAVTVAQDIRSAIEGADIVVTTTPAKEPLVMADWLTPGQHLTAMGSDAEHKNEIEPALAVRADLYVADRLSQTRRLGELHHAIKVGIIDPETVFAELGAVVAGTATGRTGAGQITYADLTGTGVQDTAIANLARTRAQSAQAGTMIST